MNDYIIIEKSLSLLNNFQLDDFNKDNFIKNLNDYLEYFEKNNVDINLSNLIYDLEIKDNNLISQNEKINILFDFFNKNLNNKNIVKNYFLTLDSIFRKKIEISQKISNIYKNNQNNENEFQDILEKELVKLNDFKNIVELNNSIFKKSIKDYTFEIDLILNYIYIIYKNLQIIAYNKKNNEIKTDLEVCYETELFSYYDSLEVDYCNMRINKDNYYKINLNNLLKYDFNTKTDKNYYNQALHKYNLKFLFENVSFLNFLLDDKYIVNEKYNKKINQTIPLDILIAFLFEFLDYDNSYYILSNKNQNVIATKNDKKFLKKIFIEQIEANNTNNFLPIDFKNISNYIQQYYIYTAIDYFYKKSYENKKPFIFNDITFKYLINFIQILCYDVNLSILGKKENKKRKDNIIKKIIPFVYEVYYFKKTQNNSFYYNLNNIFQKQFKNIEKNKINKDNKILIYSIFNQDFFNEESFIDKKRDKKLQNEIIRKKGLNYYINFIPYNFEKNKLLYNGIKNNKIKNNLKFP